jgi:predicted RNA-binding Zn ribbon-like protein
MAEFTFPANDPGLDLLNTRPDGGDDRLRSADDVVHWMDAAGLIQAGERPWRWNDKADPLLPRVKRLRETVREQVEAIAAGRAPSAGVVQSLQRAAADAPDGPRVTRPDQLYALLARAAATLLTGGAAGLRKRPSPDGDVWVRDPA